MKSDSLWGRDIKRITKKETVNYAYILLVTFLLLFVCSKNSPIYPMNDWVDVNIFLTIGRAMLKGQTLYKDVFDVKGPFTYAFHALASMFSDGCFFFLFLSEVLSGFVFIWFSSKIYLMFSKAENPEDRLWAGIPLFAAMLFFANCFEQGDSVEEFMLPLLSASLYITLKHSKDETWFTDFETFGIGFMAGIVFWSKYSVLGLFVGLCLFVIFKLGIRERNFSTMAKSILLFLTGFVLVTLPVLLYFIKTNALTDLFQVYFFQNIVTYHHDLSIADNIINRLIIIWNDFPFYFLLLLSVIRTLRMEKPIKIVLLMTEVFTIFTSLCMEVFFVYYAIPCYVFSVFGFLVVEELVTTFCDRLKGKRLYAICIAAEFLFILLAIGEWPKMRCVYWVSLSLLIVFLLLYQITLDKGKRKIKTELVCLTVMLSLLFSYTVAGKNIYLAFTRRESMPQFQFANQIRQDTDPVVLEYHIQDHGFYYAAGIDTVLQYPCYFNYSTQEVQDICDGYVLDGKPDYIITDIINLSEHLEQTVSYHATDYGMFRANDGYKYFVLYQKDETARKLEEE